MFTLRTKRQLSDKIKESSEQNLLKLLKLVKGNLNDIVITDSYDLKRLIGLEDDGDDYYYVYKSLHGIISYDSCVGGFLPMKNKYSKKIYKSIDNTFKLNDNGECEIEQI